MPKAELRVSIVIPAYNEEDHLAACLEAIARQTVRPHEVIVVDNNSSDNTATIAESFSFVTILHETRQGVVYARDRGFNAATGDIIGRIDADTILPPDWTGRLQKLFTDPLLAAVTGSVHYYDIPFSEFIDAVDLACRKWLVPHLGSYVYLLGSNMAIRQSAWQSVRKKVCHRHRFHEDMDLAVHLGGLDRQVNFAPELNAGISGRRIDTGSLNFWHYVYHNVYTYKQHRLSERRAMYPIVALITICHLPLRILYRSFDPVEHKFIWRRTSTASLLPRVDPATFID